MIANISLYIPHIFANYEKADVAKVFEDLHIGKVNHIDFVSKLGKDGKPFNAAYIHFDYWFDTVVAANFQDRVKNPNKEARLMYEDPWYWIVLENKAQKFTPGDRKPRIDLGDLKPQNGYSTPSKTINLSDCVDLTNAPVKGKSYKEAAVACQMPTNLNGEFEDEYDADYNKVISEMEECEAAMMEDDAYLTSIDVRYLQTLEQENTDLRNSLFQYQNAMYAEQIKSQALAEVIQKFHKD
jgi:hypothetical protein